MQSQKNKKIPSVQFSEDQQLFHYGTSYDVPKGWVELGRNCSHKDVHRFTHAFYDGKFGKKLPVEKVLELFEKKCLSTKIRVIKVSDYNNGFFFSVNDFFKYIESIGIIPLNTTYRWDYIRSLYKKHYEVMIKEEVWNFQVVEFIQFSFMDIFVRNYSVYKIINFMPKSIRHKLSKANVATFFDQLDLPHSYSKESPFDKNLLSKTIYKQHNNRWVRVKYKKIKQP